MYSLRLEDGTFIAGLFYKPTVGMKIRIDSTDKWFRVTSLFGRIAYSRETFRRDKDGR